MSSSSGSSQPKRLGRRVFPNQQSDQIRRSQQFLHYVPPPEPPVDYTIRVPQGLSKLLYLTYDGNSFFILHSRKPVFNSQIC